MKWFQHQSDSYSNLKLRLVLNKYGLTGYGLFWLCCEVVAQQGNDYHIPASKCWKEVLRAVSGLRSDHVERVLNYFAEINLIDPKFYKEKNALYIPKMREYSDDYTKKVRRVSEQDTENVRQDKSRIDKIRLDKNTLPPSAEKNMYKLQPDNPDKTINYDALEEESESKQEQKAHKGYDPKDTNLLLAWGAEKLGRKFNKPLKQKKHIADMLAASNTPEAIKAKWEELEEDDFWADKGIDFSIVASQIDKVKTESKPNPLKYAQYRN